MWTARGATAELTTHPSALAQSDISLSSCLGLSLSHLLPQHPDTKTHPSNTQPGLSQSDAPFWQHTGRYIRGKNLSWSLIKDVKLLSVQVERGFADRWRWSDWEKKKCCRIRTERKREETQGLTLAARKLLYVVTVKKYIHITTRKY